MFAQLNGGLLMLCHHFRIALAPEMCAAPQGLSVKPQSLAGAWDPGTRGEGSAGGKVCLHLASLPTCRPGLNKERALQWSLGPWPGPTYIGHVPLTSSLQVPACKVGATGVRSVSGPPGALRCCCHWPLHWMTSGAQFTSMRNMAPIAWCMLRLLPGQP